MTWTLVNSSGNLITRPFYYDTLGVDPNNADVCLDLGRLAMSRRRWDEALGFLMRAADRSPEAVEPLYNLGQVYGMMGRHDEAERYRRLADRRRQAQPPSRRRA